MRWRNVYAKLEEVGQKGVAFPHHRRGSGQDSRGHLRGGRPHGRIRRNVLDTRRALSFLMRGKFLSEALHLDVREILRDIESWMDTPAFLFNKINFLMMHGQLRQHQPKTRISNA